MIESKIFIYGNVTVKFFQIKLTRFVKLHFPTHFKGQKCLRSNMVRSQVIWPSIKMTSYAQAVLSGNLLLPSPVIII